MMPPNMMNVPPQMVPPPQHNMNLIGPPGMPPMMPPPVMNPSIPPNRNNEDHRNNQSLDKRNESGPPPQWRPRDNRDKERDYRERDRGNILDCTVFVTEIILFILSIEIEEESPSERERRRERERYRSDRDRGSSRRFVFY